MAAPMIVDLSAGSLEVLVGGVLISVDLHISHVFLFRGGGCVHLDEPVLGATDLADQLLVGVP